MTEDRWQVLRDSIQALLKADGAPSLRQLAERPNVDQGQLSKFLNGKTKSLSGDAVAELAEALGTTVGALWGEQTTPLVGLRHAELAKPIRNPRNVFDKEDLQELAASIAVHGVLENLVVQPANAKGLHPVVIGERRHQAVGLLVDAGETIAGVPAADYRIACQIVDGTPIEIMEKALAENIHRKDLTPMEEAEAFEWLRDEAKWSTAQIAEKIGKTQRFVQRRLTLVDKLSKPAQTALRKGDINFAQAEALSVGKASEQKEALGNIKEGYGGWATAEGIKRHLLSDKYPVDRAHFDRSLYNGKYIQDEGGEDAYFADSAQFERLQREAAAATLATLKEEWSWGELYDSQKGQYFSEWQYKKSTNKKKAGAVVEIRYNMEVKITRGIVPDTGTAAAKSATPKPKKHFSDKHLQRAKNLKTAALQDAVLQDHGAALRLCVMGLLGEEAVKVSVDRPDGADVLSGAKTIEASLRTYTAIGGKKEDASSKDETTPRLQDPPMRSTWQSGMDPVKVWDILTRMKDAEVLQVLAVVIAGQTGSWNGYQAQLGDSAFVARLAADLGVDMQPTADAQLRDEDFLKSCGKQHAIEIARDLGAPAKIDTGKKPKPIEDMTAKFTRLQIGSLLDGGAGKDYIPRELKFGTEADLKKRSKPLPTKVSDIAKKPADDDEDDEPAPPKADAGNEATIQAAGDLDVPEFLRRS